ncbi:MULTISPECIES: glycosyltransferase [Psychrobacter]|uniref:glycosyltransferase n=1 Tax=Psychrobacter TaxID=497 RepID=UPI000ECE089A|nr:MULTISPECIES: glycosyltransferase [Psychrobacter]HCN16700.1 hypothetical protein [Psychrobacter sp.]
MKIYFLTGLFSNEDYYAILKNSKSNVQNAADVLQKRYLDGFCDLNLDKKIAVINLPFIGSYPEHFKKVFFTPTHDEIIEDRYTLKNISFCNIRMLKNLSRTYKSLYYSYKAISSDRDNHTESNETYFFIYTMHLPFLLTGFLLKQVFRDINFVVIVPDLPEDMNAGYGFFKGVFNGLGSLSYTLTNHLDGVIVITEAMQNKFAPHLKKAVIEGMASTSDFGASSKNHRAKDRFFLYSGGLNKKFGIKNLIDSFINSNLDNVNLYICGDGPDKQYVIDAANTYNNIKYLGLLNRKEVLDLQQQAALLINPRTNALSFTKYSFPSKVLEYMSSGTPVLMYRLDGIPEEYYAKTYSLKDSEDNLASAMKYINSLSDAEMHNKGLEAKEFVLKYKNPLAQVNKALQQLRKDANNLQN